MNLDIAANRRAIMRGDKTFTKLKS